MIDYVQTDVSIDDLSPRTQSWREWMEVREQPVAHLAAWAGPELSGYSSPTKIGGVVIHPAEVVLGLRGWDDAYEGTGEFGDTERQCPWVLFDLEKIIRMMLHQSGLALEILASPMCVDPDKLTATPIDARRIVESAITSDVLHHYADLVRSGRRRLGRLGSEYDAYELLDSIRSGLTGMELAEGSFAVDLDTLVERRAESALADVISSLREGAELGSHAVEELDLQFGRWLDVLEEPGATPLPESPRDYAWLHDYLVERRLHTTEGLA